MDVFQPKKCNYALFLFQGFLACTLLSTSFTSFAGTLVPIKDHGGMSLGVGINVLKQNSVTPSCFNSVIKNVDGEESGGQFKVKINAVSSIDEIARVKTSAANIAGKYGTAKISASVNKSNSRKESRGTVYVVIDVWGSGPRRGLFDVAVKPEFVELMKTGSAQEVISKCGTHVLYEEYRETSLRIVLNMSNASSEAKSQMLATLGMKGSYGAGSVKASASYASSVLEIHKKNQVELDLQGTGRMPEKSAITELIKSSGGDLDVTADKIRVLFESMEKAGPKYVPYAYYAQPMHLWAKNMYSIEDNQEGVTALDELNEFTLMLTARLEDTDKLLRTTGLAPEEIPNLEERTAKLQKDIQLIRTESVSCLPVEAADSKSCQNTRRKWQKYMSTNYGGEIKFDFDKDKGLRLLTKFSSPAQATISAEIHGEVFPIETFEIFPSEEPIGITIFRQKMSSVTDPNGLKTNKVESSLPAVFGLLVIPRFAEVVKPKGKMGVNISCNGISVWDLNQVVYSGPKFSFPWSLDESELSSDSPCVVQIFSSPGSNPFPSNPSLPMGPLQLSPTMWIGPPLRSIKWDMEKVTFYVTVTDKYGFSTEHKLNYPTSIMKVMLEPNTKETAALVKPK